MRKFFFFISLFLSVVFADEFENNLITAKNTSDLTGKDVFDLYLKNGKIINCKKTSSNKVVFNLNEINSRLEKHGFKNNINIKFVSEYNIILEGKNLSEIEKIIGVIQSDDENEENNNISLLMKSKDKNLNSIPQSIKFLSEDCKKMNYTNLINIDYEKKIVTYIINFK